MQLGFANIIKPYVIDRDTTSEMHPNMYLRDSAFTALIARRGPSIGVCVYFAI